MKIKDSSKTKPFIIAIDGPAASGKSTTARLVARELGYLYLDTGAMYRAVTLAAIRSGIPVTDETRIAEMAASLDIALQPQPEGVRVILEGKDVSSDIRLPEVTQQISPVAANPAVRAIMVESQREMGKQGRIVIDGRDIGTVVFPDAGLKIYMKASAAERARRRVKELKQRGIQTDTAAIEQEIRNRDREDTTRIHGPLRQAKDAFVIDTTLLSIAEQVNRIVTLARQEIKNTQNTHRCC